ncbi:unnamed protein product [Caenorhabditis sp. 36 PRJEB53466]|nr:unnamed protein product [Caenorhabditis sp. 36 PRJEB53466]
MPTSFNPNRVHLDDPIVCRCIPMKYVVVIVQAIFIAVTIWVIIDSQTNDYFTYPAFAVVISVLISFVGYVVEYKPIMVIHFWIATIGLLVPICFTFFNALFFFLALIPREKKYGNYLMGFILSFIGLIIHLCYVWMCRQLVKKVEGEEVVLPEFDTTQGLFQFTSYDGKHISIYPKL